MQPFDDEREPGSDPAARKRQSTLVFLVIIAVLAFVVLAVVVHLTGATPSHGG
jgi:flagellar basal body-associated protein FliL